MCWVRRISEAMQGSVRDLCGDLSGGSKQSCRDRAGAEHEKGGRTNSGEESGGTAKGLYVDECRCMVGGKQNGVKGIALEPCLKD